MLSILSANPSGTNGASALQSVGLSPPLFEPSHPNFVDLKAIMQDIRASLAQGQQVDLSEHTTTTATQDSNPADKSG